MLLDHTQSQTIALTGYILNDPQTFERLVVPECHVSNSGY